MTTNYTPTSGAAVREKRIGAGISARALALKSGLSHTHLVRFESGERQVSETSLARIVTALAEMAARRDGAA